MGTRSIKFLTFLVVLYQFKSLLAVGNDLESGQASLNIAQVSNEILDFSQGCPDYHPPYNLLQSISKVLNSGDYSLFQYSIPGGNLRLRKAIAKFYSKLLDHSLIANENIVTTLGATQAIQNIFTAFTKPGDEWIFFEPIYVHYIPALNKQSGIVKSINLKPRKTGNNVTSSDWTFDKSEFSRLFNNKTRGIVINNPNNPLGKVFTYEELEFIAKLAKQWNVIVMSDEVYEFLIFNNKKHIRIATFPGMFERTITVSSISKSYSATGIRVGWAIGPKELIQHILNVCPAAWQSNTPFVEEGVAAFLEEEFEKYGKPSSYMHQIKEQLENKRNIMINFLRQVGLTPIIPDGGIYIIANWTLYVNRFLVKDEITEDGETSFTNWLLENLCINIRPMSDYYTADNKHFGAKSIRFIFAKTDEQLSKTEKLLLNWRKNEK